MLIKPMIQVKRITKSVSTSEGELPILHPISLDIMMGESIAITGSSGSGKSTLLGILAGLDTPSSGEVFLARQCISAMDEEGRAKVRADAVGFIFQSFQLLPGLSALENVMLPLELKGNKLAKQLAMDFLSRVGLVDRLKHYPQQLSGGEQQRVAIARAFASQPLVLFADEPTGNLDSHTGQKVIDLLFELNRDQATTLVFVTHEERLANLCQRRFTLEAGKIIHTATSKGENHVGLQVIAA
ncbi:ABC transporter ATP-binding protein [Undibacterium sp.]|uniref:ABC transporter ATP-binding protein n=1 Tax=Undibacterium sp. TaxID=1914977 RepID=UPI00375052F1